MYEEVTFDQILTAFLVIQTFLFTQFSYFEELIKFSEEHGDPFHFSQITYIRDVKESIWLNTMDEPSIIISASGMCEGGRILHHLRNNIEDPKNTILFIGYHLHSLAHTQVVIDETFDIYEEVMKIVDSAIRNGSVLEQLKGPVLAPIFANVGDRSGGPSVQGGRRSESSEKQAARNARRKADARIDKRIDRR